MRSAIVSVLGLGLLLGVLVTPPARAGVPRSCLHMTFDPVECARETRQQHRKVLPARRVRELDRQRQELSELAPEEDLRRNELLLRLAEELAHPQP